jgi:glycine/D-amino acid oxidase-like deaminating enzyme
MQTDQLRTPPEGSGQRRSSRWETDASLPVVDPEIERALRFLQASAAKLGEAAGRASRAEDMLSHIEALAALHSDERSADMRKHAARASQQYRDALEERAAAVAAYQELRAKREAAVHLIEAWRTAESTRRAYRL